MARRVRDRAIETREARRKLKLSGKPYWRAIGKGLHVGYRKGKSSGVWVVRRYLGIKTTACTPLPRLTMFSMPTARRFSISVKHRKRTQSSSETEARRLHRRSRRSRLYRSLEGRASWHDTKKRMEAFVLPAFGDKKVS